MREWSSHSYEKISILGDHLRAFAKASQSAPERVYIDAFAGDTENELRATGESFLAVRDRRLMPFSCYDPGVGCRDR